MPTAAGAKTLWLCKPGLAKDACTPSLKTTEFSPAGKRLGVSNVKRVRRPKFDCFYVYPTVSNAKGATAPLRVDPELRSIARYQAARYSRDCRVYAPVYRQVTVGALAGGATTRDRDRAYGDVRAAWRDYLRKHNKGRGVVLIGHSQGTFVLRDLIAKEIDPKPRERRRLISALLLGGNVLVAKGKDRGGDFKRLRACRSSRQLGCIVAFVTFQGAVPTNSIFGRTSEANREVLCTNPAALGGGAGITTPIFPTQPFAPGAIAGAIQLMGVEYPKAKTAWASLPNAYRARCSKAGGASVLQIASRRGAPIFKPSPDAGWGLHLVDANIALEELTALVRKQGARYVKRQEN